ncbi:hypothetical protein M0R19_02570 [Candidatus Pacearchaeota archaeon]|nr:hypothetical protein [Candidatus Pacearchaeota archaeon]
MIYLISNTGSIGLTPPGIPIIDQYILHPWWNSSPSAWESTLDILSDSESLRKITLIQFNNIQISPLNLFKNHNYLGIVQEFFIYPVMSQGHQGYSPITQEYTFKIFCFLLIFSLVFSFKINYKKIKPDLKLFIVGVISLLIFTLIGWARSPVFRYFIFIDFLMLILLVLPILEFKKINKKIAILIIFIVMMSICINLASEVKRDNNYIYTVGHQALISQNGGIFESIELSKFIKDNTPTDSFVFTNIAEVGFYSERKIIWDDRLFFIKNKDDLKKILKNYNFDYLVIPYYSGVESYDNWKYYQGIPKDSEFNKLLLDNSVFTKIKVYNSSTLYRFNKNET